MTTRTNLTPWIVALRQRPRREQLAVLTAAGVVGFGLVWGLLVAPAWHTLETAPAKSAQLAPQLHTMRHMAAQAQRLQAQTTAPLPHKELIGLVEVNSQRLFGTRAQIAPSTDRITVTLQAVESPALAQWLHDLRINARLLPTEVRLTPSNNQPGGALWQGTVILMGAGLEQP